MFYCIWNCFDNVVFFCFSFYSQYVVLPLWDTNFQNQITTRSNDWMQANCKELSFVSRLKVNFLYFICNNQINRSSVDMSHCIVSFT